jgi:hypothetical protein
MQPKVALKITATRDPLTGRNIERISLPDRPTALPYFTKELFTPDNRGVLVTCRDDRGDWFPWIIRPDDGEMRRVGDVPCASEHNPAIGGGRVVYISKDRRIGYAAIDGSGEFTPVIALAEGVQLGEVCASACGRYVVTCYSEDLPAIASRASDGFQTSASSEPWWFGRRWCMLRVDLDAAVSRAVAGGERRSGHPMISPANADVMEYCTYAPWDQEQRMFAVRVFPESTYCDVRPLYPQRVGLEAVGHECFLADGRVAAIHMWYERLDHKSAQPDDSSILVADPITHEHHRYRTPGLVFNHLHGRDGRTFVSEGRSDLHIHKTPAPKGTPQDKLLDLMCRYDVAGDHTIATPLCAHGCSWRGQSGHPHAVLCRENRWCYFNSDREGTASVFRVRMD